MTEEQFVRMRLLDFILEETDRLTDEGMDQSKAARMVLQVSFDTVVTSWKDVYGSRKMAEHFYRMADGFVCLSN
jgi:hypothetical protein